MEKPVAERSASLDTLRGIAILLVLIRHLPLPLQHGDGWWQPLELLQRGGWCGVDLFFVLSGFLVSSILFREWKHSSQLHAGRFLLRRAFKIYPAFYVMLAFVVSWAAWHGRFPHWSYIASEALFVQNYGPALFPHSWSLGVEEHFYLCLPVVLWLTLGKREDPFGRLPIVIGVALAACLALRLQATWGVDLPLLAKTDPNRARFLYAATHLRVDSLLFGVLIAWIYNFRRPLFDQIAKHRLALLAAGIALFSPAFIYQIGVDVSLFEWGFTLLYLGAGALLIAFVKSNWSFRPVARIGIYSYSIYLWHIPVQRILLPLMLPKDFPPGMTCGLYFVASIIIGILFAYLIEIPAVRIRDRFFP